jgi:cytochrome c-type biogenesis protein CcmH/NrfG
MTNFKQKLDNMMGDTGEQERRIHAGVRGKMLQSSTSSKKNWRINAVAAAFIVLTVVLSASLYKNYQFSQSEGQGRPYDPAIDIVEMQKLRAQEQFSGFEGNEFLMLPTLKTLTPLQYVAK